MAENAAASAIRPRPLSPHLQIYRWTPTMLSSITHRATGIALTVGMAGLAWWLMALASGPDAYDLFRLIAFSLPGLVAVFGFTWSLSYHLLNGIRHLVWDIGFGYAPRAANRVSVTILIASIVLAAALFGYALFAAGGVQ